MPSRGCWTCKARKVACDRELPFCRNCSKSGRACEGYGIKLSWPRKDDRKRSLVSILQKRAHGPLELRFMQAEFINVFSSDVERLHAILDPSKIITQTLARPRINQNPRWTPFPLNGTEADLFSYYHNYVSKRLIGVNNPQVQSLAIRMSFGDASPAASAILYTLFALASIHLSDRSSALRYKSKAINAVWESAAQRTTVEDVLRRIVAVNFLAMFETLLTADVAPDWAADVCFAKTATIATYALDQKYQGDLALILDWVYYYDVLSKFSVRHFDRRGYATLLCAKKENLMVAAMNSPDTTHILPTLGCSLEVLTAISTLINTVIVMETDDDPHTETLDRIERRLKYAQQEVQIEDLDDTALAEATRQIRSIAELYRLAGLIYLYRAGRKTSPSNSKLQSFVEAAFRILGAMQTCERTFPLFVVSCEARTDVQKAIVLQLLSATQTRFTPSNILRVHNYIERFWAADELDANQEIDYAEKVTAILSSSGALPAFA